MSTVNPLVVASVDKPADAWAGVWIAEDIELIAQGVRNGSWIDGTLGVTGARQAVKNHAGLSTRVASRRGGAREVL